MLNRIKRGVLDSWEDFRNPKAVFRGRAGEVHEAEVMMPFGLSYCPPDDAEAIILPAQGKSDHAVSPGFTGGDARPKAEQGQSILYSSSEGTQVRVNPDGTIEMTTAGGGTFRLEGGKKIVTNMTIETSGDIIADGVSLKEHRHTGVQSGGSLSGQPDA